MLGSVFIFVLALLELTAAQITANCAQLEPISVGEVEFVEKKDDDFDQVILSSVARPSTSPTQTEAASLYYDSFKAGTIVPVVEPLSGCQGDTGTPGFTQLAEVNLYVRYLLYQDWYINYIKCCPASQNYGCRGVKTPHPCFYTSIKGMFAWCCPLQRVAITNCNCGKCLMFCNDCFYLGQCKRRYTYTKFAAVCFIRWWGTVINVASYLPTSCYCRQT
ncbi:uncharacterized protein LOC131937607 [Physella acuta]|uniref:uncharacterized protein LOC131937607 n=1 Tax=Physella acuta TaxID=109671 RepID=UPI0027DB9928|nr:uncharacterized protein LOC131937607 [Physella acuta]